MIAGGLKAESPLRRVFPDGIAPLRYAVPTAAVLGAGPDALHAEVYLVDLFRCTPRQRESLARIVAQACECDLHDVLAEMNETADLPVRISHFLGVAYPRRLLA